MTAQLGRRQRRSSNNFGDGLDFGAAFGAYASALRALSARVTIA